MEYVLLGVFLIIEGINRIGFRFQADELVKGILLAAIGIVLIAPYVLN